MGNELPAAFENLYCSISWKDPRKHTPKQGSVVAVIKKNFKSDTIFNYSIHFGMVIYCGKSEIHAYGEDEKGYKEMIWQIKPVKWPDTVYAWTYAKRMNIPEWEE